MALVNVVGTMIRLKGFSARLFGTLSRHDINIILITQASSEHSISFVVASEDVAKARLAIEEEFHSEITTEKLQHPEIDTNISIVAIVGERMKKQKVLVASYSVLLGKTASIL